MRHTVKAASIMSVAALALSACGGSDSGGDATSGEGGGSDVKACLAYDVGGRGDQSFNDSAAKGLDQAKDELGVEIDEVEASQGENDAAREDRLNQLVDAGCTNIIGVGFIYANAIGAAAKANQDISFAVIDDASDASKADNVAQLTFAEQEGSFLVGAAAAMKSKSGKVGFIGGTDVPLINKFEAGFEAGAKAVDPKIDIQVKYLAEDGSGFADPAKGKTAAQGMYDKGADVVYHAAGGSGSGVFKAASESKKMAIGVDSDQAKTADASVRDVIITSMVKNVDVAVFDYIKASVDGKPQSGNIVYGLKEGGVSYATTGGKIDDITKDLDDYEQQIIDGKISVPSK
ncbi:BMP family ABC transporter substrate-binding protein [Janibacter terrae]|uniref:BMP family ABC transporter substrate-binding protein n=1 Tax=Janibacter terrae TaxID=103817 RepID=A0ABZ2FAH5_9MICO|nr:BMP family ABC transporter substrate-binding protein [Janibacter terrae]